MSARYLTHRCPQCLQPRLFRLTEREERRRMVCAECGLDLPAVDGPVTDWRELLEGSRLSEAPDDGRRPPA